VTRVLALDTATKTGLAFGEVGHKPRSWSVDLGKVPWERRFSKTLRMVRQVCTELHPDLVVVEQFVGGPKANVNLVGLVACALGEADRMGIATVTYYPASVRKHFLGGIRGAGKIKDQVYARCKMLGWDVDDLDAADALALWDYACAMQSRSHQMATVGGIFGVQK